MATKTYPRVVQLLNEEISVRISRNEFCRITGINRNSIDRYKGGVGTPILETLQKLSDYFGVTVEWLRGGSGKPSPRLVKLLQEALVEGRFTELQTKEAKLLFGEPPKPVTIELLLQHNAEPNEATLKQLSDFFVVSVPYLRGDSVRTSHTEENAAYLAKRGQAYMELLEIAPDRLKGFVLHDLMFWRDEVFEFTIDECADLTDSEGTALQEVKDKADTVIDRAENGEFPWYNGFAV